jgi:hypothetical protein
LTLFQRLLGMYFQNLATNIKLKFISQHSQEIEKVLKMRNLDYFLDVFYAIYVVLPCMCCSSYDLNQYPRLDIRIQFRSTKHVGGILDM